MPMYIPRPKKNEICQCGRTFVKKTPNQIHCPDCSYWSRFRGNIIKFIVLAEPRLKKAADESGNPKVWTAKEYSQEELKRLIPTR
jgi:hypothetical protein